MGKLAFRGWEFRKNVLQVIPGAGEEGFQAIVCCRFWAQGPRGEGGRAAIAGVE